MSLWGKVHPHSAVCHATAVLYMLISRVVVRTIIGNSSAGKFQEDVPAL